LYCYLYGNDEHHAEFVERYLPKLENILVGVKGTRGTVKRHGNIKFHQYTSGTGSESELASGRHGWDLKESWKGYSAVANQTVGKNAFRVLAESIFESEPLTRRYIEMKPLGGAIRKKKKHDTAFWHRDAIWWLLSNHYYNPDDPAKHVSAILHNSSQYLDIFIERMGDSFSGFYAGYINHSNSTGRDLELYYGENAKRISDIKMKRDPHNVFRLFVPNAPENAPFDANAGGDEVEDGHSRPKEAKRSKTTTKKETRDIKTSAHETRRETVTFTKGATKRRSWENSGISSSGLFN